MGVCKDTDEMKEARKHSGQIWNIVETNTQKNVRVFYLLKWLPFL